MRIKTFVSAAAIALVAGLGSASAEERFDVIHNINIEKISQDDLNWVDRWVLYIFSLPARIDTKVVIKGHYHGRKNRNTH